MISGEELYLIHQAHMQHPLTVEAFPWKDLGLPLQAIWNKIAEGVEELAASKGWRQE